MIMGSIVPRLKPENGVHIIRKPQRTWALAIFSIAALIITLQVPSKGALTVLAKGGPVTVRVQASVNGNPDATCRPNGHGMMRVTVKGARNLAALQFARPWVQPGTVPPSMV